MEEITTEERRVILNKCFLYLKGEGIINTQEDFANSLEVSRPSVNRALNGDKDYCTESIANKLSNRYSTIFRREYVMYGEEPMLLSNQSTPIIINNTNNHGQLAHGNITHSTNNANSNSQSEKTQRLESELRTTKTALKKAEEEIGRLRNELAEHKEEYKTLNIEYRKLVNKLLSIQ